MKKLIDIDEIYLTRFREQCSLLYPRLKITDKALVNFALKIAYEYQNDYPPIIIDVPSDLKELK